MSSMALMLVVVGLLALLGTATLVFITVSYYWGDRGRPPLSGEARRLQQEEELRLRAKQIEYAKRPRTKATPRGPK